MSEMIEKCTDEAVKLIEGYNLIGKKTPIKEIVIKVIEALREPTEEMLLAGTDQPNHYRVWLAMIDEILK